MRPVLDLVDTERLPDQLVGLGRVQVMRLEPLPQILRLGKMDLRHRGREIVFALLRAELRGWALPDRIIISFDAQDLWARRVVADLCLIADPTSSARRTVFAIAEPVPVDMSVPLTAAQSLDVAESLLRGSSSPDAKRQALDMTLNEDVPPAASNQQARVRALTDACLAGDDFDFAAVIQALRDARLARRATPVGLVRRLRTHLSAEDWAFTRTVCTFHMLLDKVCGDTRPEVLRRQCKRLERRARSAGMARLRGSAAAWRRFTARNQGRLHGLVRGLRAVLLTYGAGPGTGLPGTRLASTRLRTGMLHQRAQECALHLYPSLEYRVGDPVKSANEARQSPSDTTRPNRIIRSNRLAAMNQFRLAEDVWPSEISRTLHLPSLSLGLFGKQARLEEEAKLFRGSFLPALWEKDKLAHTPTQLGIPRSDPDHAWIHSWQTKDASAAARRRILEATQFDRAWARKLVLACVGADLSLHAEDAEGALRVLGAACKSYGEFRRLEVETGRRVTLSLLKDFEARCTEALHAAGHPPAQGGHAVSCVKEQASRLPKLERGRTPLRVMEALGAIVATGRGAPTEEKEQRVADQLARMLGARVLFERRGDTITERVSQVEHTLDSWSMRKLVKNPKARAVRVRPSQLQYTLAQRRPRALLVGKLGTAVFCFGRDASFRRREVQALDTIASFYDAHTSAQTSSEPQPDTRVQGSGPDARPIPGLIGTSAPWTGVLDQIWRLGPANCNVLVLGESGTGKEHVARALHLVSDRAQGPFVPVHCGGLAPELMLAELFGHVAGAFTGATAARPGLLASADGGTLFLDELGEIPAAMQIALLRVLEDRCVRPVGGTRDRAIDVRIVAATHRDLDQGIADGTLRLDFVHRLDVARIAVPPLRERREDIQPLARHLLAREGLTPTLDPSCWPMLQSYTWPGNVRELANVLTAAALLADQGALDAAALAPLLERRRVSVRTPQPQARELEPLGPRATKILDLMGDGWCGTRSLAERTGVSTRTVNREIARLVERGRLEATGSGSLRRYRRV